ncbi:cytochrome P450 [Mycena latifolia]|nr:cytochrome P450 [Mycena latifolia]
MISQILLPMEATLLFYVLFHVARAIYRELTSPLRHVVGPKNPSFIFGHVKQMADDALLTEKWSNEFGPNFQFRGLFNIRELYTSDIKAVNHIVTNSTIYQKAPFIVKNARRTFGKGILGVEMDDHKRHYDKYRDESWQNPAFGIAEIRAVTEIFVEKAVQLRDIWTAQVAPDHGAGRIEVLSWLRRMTLDVIGQAGFNYQFDALNTNGKPNELNQAITDLLHSPEATRNHAFRLAQAMVPILKILVRKCLRMLGPKCRRLEAISLSQSKAAVKASGSGKALGGRRDLLSVLLKANLSSDIPDSQRLTDEEVLGQIPTFLIAGHETTSSATAWALHALSLNIAAQSKLRTELLVLSTGNPTMDELNSLPYLEMVVRETMRVHASVAFIKRMAMQDDVLPLAKPYVDKTGKAHHSLPIPKGQMMQILILGVNTDKDIWGPDAGEFKPERWEKLPDAASEVPGWGNLFTFFAGPHNCIGFRFSLVETKALLFTLIRAFEFEPAVPKGGIGPTSSLLRRPMVLAEKGKGSQLPLIVKGFHTQDFQALR